MTHLSRARTLVILLGSVCVSTVALAGCASSGHSAKATHTATTVRAAHAAISGKTVEVSGASNAQAARPITAVAAAYRGMSPSGSVSGAPVARANSTASNGGRFTLTVPPGVYFLVVEASTGKIMSSPQRVDVSARSAISVTLQIAVP